MVCQTRSVPEFCTCGAQLPPDARFCHKCGKPQYDYPAVVEVHEQPPVAAAPVPIQGPPEISFHNRLAVRIGFLAALIAVLLLLLPLPNSFVFLRLLVAFVAAGFLAVFLYVRRTGQVLSVRSGARMGWITGIFSFTLISVLFTAAMIAISNQGGLVKFFRSQLPANDAQTETLQQVLNDPAALAGGMIFFLILMFILLTALPMIGGALGAKVFEKNDA